MPLYNVFSHSGLQHIESFIRTKDRISLSVASKTTLTIKIRLLLKRLQIQLISRNISILPILFRLRRHLNRFDLPILLFIIDQRSIDIMDIYETQRGRIIETQQSKISNIQKILHMYTSQNKKMIDILLNKNNTLHYIATNVPIILRLYTSHNKEMIHILLNKGTILHFIGTYVPIILPHYTQHNMKKICDLLQNDSIIYVANHIRQLLS